MNQTLLAVLRNISNEFYFMYENTVETIGVDEFLMYSAGGEL